MSEKATLESSEENKRLQWRLSVAQKRFTKLLKILETEVDENTRMRIIQRLGCECSKSIPFIQEYEGDLQGYWAEIEKRWGEKAEFDPVQGIITIATPERDCVCPLVDSQHTPPSFCDCSLGWQQQTYETLLGKPIMVEIKESVLRGAKRCVFEIRLEPSHS